MPLSEFDATPKPSYTGDDDRVGILLRLFTEITIIDRLACARFEAEAPEDTPLQSFAILHHFYRLGLEEDDLATLIWSLASADPVAEEEIRVGLDVLVAQGLLQRHGDRVAVTEAGCAVHAAALQKIAPTYVGCMEEFSSEQLASVTETLMEIRRTFENQPDR